MRPRPRGRARCPSDMPGGQRPLLRGGELLVDEPLQPAEEVDPVGELRRGAATTARPRVAAASPATRDHAGPCTSASAHQVAKSRRPGALALAGIGVVGLPAGVRGPRRADGERRPLRLPDRVAVDQHVGSVARAQLAAPHPLDLGARRPGEVAELRRRPRPGCRAGSRSDGSPGGRATARRRTSAPARATGSPARNRRRARAPLQRASSPRSSRSPWAHDRCERTE